MNKWVGFPFPNKPLFCLCKLSRQGIARISFIPTVKFVPGTDVFGIGSYRVGLCIDVSEVFPVALYLTYKRSLSDPDMESRALEIIEFDHQTLEKIFGRKSPANIINNLSFDDKPGHFMNLRG